MSDYAAIEKEARIFTEECVTNNRIDPALFAQYDIKRGLRDKNGNGVLAGITNISRIDAFEMRDGKRFPVRASSGIAATTSMTSSAACAASATPLRVRLIFCFWAICPTPSSWTVSTAVWQNAATCRPILCVMSL